MSPAQLAAIELAAFRGFADKRRIDLDADMVLVRGDNGSGKTSLVDGLLWLVCGELAHLSERVRGLRRTDDPIVNRYAGPPARVRLTLVVDGERFDFERNGTAASSELAAWHGSKPLQNPSTALARAFGVAPRQLSPAVRTWGVLRQDAVRAALESGGALHERLSAIVGLERVTLFAESAAKASKDLGRERTRLRRVRDEVRKQHEHAQRRLAEAQLSVSEPEESRRLLDERFDRIASALPPGIVLSASPADDLNRFAQLGTEVSALLDAANVTAERHAAAVTASEALVVAVKDAEAELADAQRRSEASTQRAPLSVQLASAALELLSDTCPVCRQPIDESSVRSHLSEMLAASQEAAAEAREARQNVARAQAQLAEAQAAEERRAEATAGVQRSIEALRERLSSSSGLYVDETWLLPDRATELVRALNELRAQLRELYEEAGRSGGGLVARTTGEVDVLTAEVHRAERDLEEIEGRCKRAVDLDRAAHQAAERIVESALSRLEPSFAEVFDRLSPHPTFTELRARQDIYYGRNQIVPEVYDPERRIAANPMLVYSEGQLNVVALSYFLGLALNAREGALPFMVLDDPLQEMDVLSVLGFADLCRRIRERHQLLVTTHDRRFADLLARKLGPREEGARTLLHEFEGWTREGPQVRSSEVPLAEVIPLLRKTAS